MIAISSYKIYLERKRLIFFSLRTGSQVRTCSDPKTNFVELVLGSPLLFVEVQVWFVVLSKQLQNWTELNFCNPRKQGCLVDCCVRYLYLYRIQGKTFSVCQSCDYAITSYSLQGWGCGQDGVGICIWVCMCAAGRTCRFLHVYMCVGGMRVRWNRQ